MDCVRSINRPLITEALLIGAQNLTMGIHVGLPNFSRKSVLQLQQAFGTPKSGLNIYATQQRRIGPLIFPVENRKPPLQPRSAQGIYLSVIMQNQRSLFPIAVSEQLDELASKRDEAAAQKIQSDSILHKRIAEMIETECQIGVEDVIYMSIVHKFSKAGVLMVQKFSESITDSDNRLELGSIHSIEVQKLITGHIARVLRMRGIICSADGSTITIYRAYLGRIYTASVLYGYLLKSACFRRQMDINLVRTHDDPFVADTYLHQFQSLVTLRECTDTQLLQMCYEFLKSDEISANLSCYVMGSDANLKSQEAVNVIENHTWALFGDYNMGVSDTDNEIVVTFPSLERLLLEAVAFGTFLWDVERSVDSSYTLSPPLMP